MKAIKEYRFEVAFVAGDKAQVVQGMNERSGQIVAIKYIPKSVYSSLDRSVIRRVVPLFSAMSHPNIVKSHAFFEEDNGVFHVMDWCEGLSLRSVIDGYSHLPEPLLARYISSALQGLNYLHSQGNTHDNLKASNILLSHGVAKLTDFGLSASISHLTLLDHPYWHAPEVLESKLFSKESDIWSLGAAIVEVLTKHPPFHHLSPEEARIRILTETPPIPASASPHLRDFLVIIFNRDPKQRPTAKELLDLFWIKTNVEPAGALPSANSYGLLVLRFPREVRMNPTPDEITHLLDDDSDDNVPSPLKPVAVPPPNQKQKHKRFMRKGRGKGSKRTSRIPGVESDDTELEFEDAGPALKPLLELPSAHESPRSPGGEGPAAFGDAPPRGSDSDTDFGQQKPGSQLLEVPPPRAPVQLPVVLHGLIALPGVGKDDGELEFDDELPSANPLLTLPTSSPPLMALPGGENEDSGLEFDDAPPGNGPLLQLPPPVAAPASLLTLPGVERGDSELDSGDGLPSAALSPIASPLDPGSGPRALLTVPGIEREDSELEFDGAFPGASPLLQLPLVPSRTVVPLSDMDSGLASEPGISDGQPLSVHGDEGRGVSLPKRLPAPLSVFAEDPGAGNDFEFEPHLVNRPLPDFSFMDEEDPNERAIFAQGQRIAELRTETLLVVRGLGGNPRAATLLANLRTIRRNLEEEPSLGNDIFREQGVLPIIELFEYSTLNDDAINELILENVYRLCCGQDRIKENFCLLGGIPPVIDFLRPRTDVRFRRFAVQILTEICRDSAGKKHELNNNNTRMFVACNGLKALVGILSYDFETEADMICTAIQTVVDILMKRQSTPRKDMFCRLFVQAGLLPPMSSILNYFANHTDLRGRPEEIRILLNNICWLITTLSQSDSFIRSELGLPGISSNMVAAMYSLEEGIKFRLNQENTLSLCQSLRNICLDDGSRDNLTEGGALHMACEMLKVNLEGDKRQVDQIRFYLLDFVSGMCKRSKFAQKAVAMRTSIVAKTALLPALRRFLSSHLQSTALNIIMTLFVVHEIDRQAMNALISDDLIDIYIDSLPQPNWGTMAINALSALSADEKLPIETFLLKRKSIEAFGLALAAVNVDHAPSFLRDLVTICERSSSFVNELVTMPFAQNIAKRLAVPVKGVTQLPAALLELVRVLFKSQAPRAVQTLRSCGELGIVVQRFAHSENLRENRFANEVLSFYGS
jgi:serine/threonine protein kinase